MPEDNRKPLQSYESRLQELASEAAKNRSRYGTISRGLGLLVVALVVTLSQAGGYSGLTIWVTLALLPLAAFLLWQFRICRRQAQRLRALEEYYRRGVARLNLNWEELDEGQDFREPEHFYATDLDLFGRGSLFQLLCSARTHVGRASLAAWMKAPAALDEVLERRAAIQELVGRQDLRERLAAAGKSVVADCRPETFQSWLAETAPPFPSWMGPGSFLLALSALLLPFVYWAHALALDDFWRLAGAVGVLQLIVYRTFNTRVQHVLESVRLPSIELPILSELLEIVEREQFRSPKLAALTARLRREGRSASADMRRLGRLVKGLDLRDNPMFTLASYVLLWATQFSAAIDRWRVRHARELMEWLQVLGEFEALLSLATYAAERPRDVLPELLTGPPEFDAEALGHPLLDEASCVRNSVRLDSGTRFVIVSGSNMSGKSTFLRSIGQNAALAWMGAPVRCSRLRISELSIAAAIRLQDSLVDGRSHFFAEMQRLRRMIQAAGDGPMLFLADEIMSGTNSHDRRIAAEWVVRALLLRGAIGAITTHDLALTEIAAGELPGSNVHFQDGGENGELLFDYTLRPGILTRSNALNIAHLLGIDEAAGVERGS